MLSGSLLVPNSGSPILRKGGRSPCPLTWSLVQSPSLGWSVASGPCSWSMWLDTARRKLRHRSTRCHKHYWNKKVMYMAFARFQPVVVKPWDKTSTSHCCTSNLRTTSTCSSSCRLISTLPYSSETRTLNTVLLPDQPDMRCVLVAIPANT